MQVKKNDREIPVRYIKGVGPQKAELFSKLGLDTINDLFYYLPRRYEDRGTISKIEDIKPGDTVSVVGQVLRTNTFRARTGTTIFEMAVGGEKRRLYAVWYNLPFMNKVFSSGQKVMLYGKVELQKRLQISHPEFEIIEGDELKKTLDVGRIVPIYSLTEKLSQKYMRKVIHSALEAHAAESLDCLPTKLRARKKLVDTKFAIENIHFPHSFENLERAYKRLVFEEFFVLQTVMALKRSRYTQNGIKHEVGKDLMDEFRGLFEFTLTKEQEKCIKDIETDMAADKPMYRLIQGDVGSGKTALAMYAMLLSSRGGYQSAMMAPTEILARQHFVTISKALMPLGINVRLLVSGLEAEDTKRIKNEISSGEADVIIGTHSLIQQGVDFSSLGLVIVDEQHKFGVDQRKSLKKKGAMPDTLVMTATPIPRSLALTVYGDMDLSLLKGKPLERQPVVTYSVSEEKREMVYDFIKDELDQGRQGFIVYPRIKKTSSSDLLAAEDMYEHLKSDVFSKYKVALVHGRMTTGEKDKIMKDFKDKKYDLLLATTVIEVGIDIPNVTVMLVEHAERYGLSQLHQLRGRIGRGRYSSYCILIGEARTDTAKERLDTMEETDDGFKIAEKDLDIRGPGELLGTRQSGLPELRFGNIVRDFDIMEEARKEAFNIVAEDPKLADPHNRGIKEYIRYRFGGKIRI